MRKFLLISIILLSTQKMFSQTLVWRHGSWTSAQGQYNFLIHSYAGQNNGSGALGNMFVGYYAGNKNVSGDDNIFIGRYSGRNNTSSRNIFLGYYSGYTNTSGADNIFIGWQSGRYNSSGLDNVAIGRQAGFDNLVGSYNTFIGGYSGLNNTTGSRNVFLGRSAGSGNSTGSGNIMIGYHAGYSETGSNKLYIDNSSTSTPLIWGDFSNNYIGINTKSNLTSTYRLSVGGGIHATNHIKTTGTLYASGGNSANWNTSYSRVISRDAGQFIRSGTNAYYNSGNVGIGTSSPNRKLTIQSSSAAYSNLKANNGTYELLVGADDGGGIISTMTNHDLDIRAGVNSTKIKVKANGNIGIGTNSPSAKLDVVGSSELNGEVTIDGNLTATGNISFPALGSIGLQNQIDNMLVIDGDGNFHRRSVASIESPWLFTQIFGQDTTSVICIDTLLDGSPIIVDVFDLNGNLSIGDDAFIDDDMNSGPWDENDVWQPDDWIKLNGASVDISSNDSLRTGLRVMDADDQNEFLNIYHDAGSSYFANSNYNSLDHYFISSNERDVTFGNNVEIPGNLGIGVSNPSNPLEVDGTIRSVEVIVEPRSSWPDYVFEEEYELTSLKETEAFIKENNHLPEVPSASEVAEEGIHLGEMNALLLKKIEELTLHTIQQQKLIEQLSSELGEVKKSLNK
ncbi:MAG: hypothetical protein AAF363_16805 [Bacteroidota bacterium]